MTNETPNPGSQEAQDMGCSCPVIDNSYGSGMDGKHELWVFDPGCPVHGRNDG